MRPVDWLLVVLLALILVPGMVSLAEVWDRLDYYSHGYMIPLVALWAASAERHSLPLLPVVRDKSGLAVLALALLGYLAGLATAVVWLTGVSLVAAVAGAVLLLRGRAWLRALAFPIAYLLFMVPLPQALLGPLILRLQLIVSSVGVAILRAFSLPVHREGNVIELAGGEQLFVADACSGITSLVTLLPLGLFLAWFTERSPWRRAVLVASVVPVAMAGNLVRVVATVLAAREFGSEVAIRSAWHDWAGILTYVLACLVLLGLGAALRRWWPPRLAGAGA